MNETTADSDSAAATLWTRKLQKLKIHFTSTAHNEIAIGTVDEDGNELSATVDEFDSEGDYQVVRLPESAWEQAKSNGTGAAMTGMLLTSNGEPRTFSRTWDVVPGTSEAPEMHPGLDMVFYAEAEWDWDRTREHARETIDDYIEASLRPEFDHDWYVMHCGELDEKSDWFIYYARTPSNAFVKPDTVDDRAFDPKRTGARPGFEYIGTWNKFCERVENGDRWPGSDHKHIAVDHEGDTDELPDELGDILEVASEMD